MKKLWLLVLVSLFVSGCGSSSIVTKADLQENNWIAELSDFDENVQFDFTVYENTIELTPTRDSAIKMVEEEFGEDNVMAALMIDTLIGELTTTYNYDMTDKGFALSESDSGQGTEFTLSREEDNVIAKKVDDENSFMTLTAK